MSDYLWDGQGAPDEFVAELEGKLSRLRHRAPLDITRLTPERRPVPYLAIAASIVLAIFAWSLQTRAPQQRTAWRLKAEGAGEGGRPVLAGERLRTGDSAVLKLEADDFGEIDLGAHSELRVGEAGRGVQKMQLDHGRLHALIWAPPRQFVVDTPSSRTIDLGCEYTLTMDASGEGFVAVETGWVAFQYRDRESFIPAGAACRTTRAAGPGIPFYQDAPAAFRSALQEYERTHDRTALGSLLAEARREDGLSLWHLIARVGDEDRRRVVERFAQLVPLGREVELEKVVAKDPAMLDRCWDALELDSAGWWREWKREWKPER